MDFSEKSKSGTELAVAGQEVAGGGDFAETHRAARAELLGGNADFGAKAELPSVCEAGGEVDVDA